MFMFLRRALNTLQPAKPGKMRIAATDDGRLVLIDEAGVVTALRSVSDALFDRDLIVNSLRLGRGSGDNASNTAFGEDALVTNTTGVVNTAIGQNALRFNTEGILNVAIGASTLEMTTTGSFNAALGTSSLRENTTGRFNCAVGNNALRENTTGEFNVAFGNNALGSNTLGGFNSAFGPQALTSNTTGVFNAAFGGNTLAANTVGTFNTAFGADALVENVSGNFNCAVGQNALRNSVSGSNNIAIGANAGSDAVLNVTTQSNQVVVGDNNVTDAYIKVAWTVTSDSRDKTEIEPISLGLDFVAALNPVSFKLMNRLTQEPTTSTRYGLLSQEVLAIEGDDPVIVNARDPENLKLNETMMIPVLVRALQEERAARLALEARLSAMEAPP